MLKCAIIGVDLERAYDRVDRDLLWHMMRSAGFLNEFIGWISTLYKGASMTVINGTKIAGTTSCLKSLKQGCLLSVHLFILYLEPLLSKLEEGLMGLQLLGTAIKTRAYVDDLAVFIEDEQDFV